MAEEKKKSKRPTALKRDLRNSKRQHINQAFKSRIRTQINTLEKQIKVGDTSGASEQLKSVYSIVDKGVKRGLINRNKAARTKAHYASLTSAK